MLTRQIDSKEKIFGPIPISCLIQAANQSDCDIYATSDKTVADIKRYDEVKNFRMTGFLVSYFKRSDEPEAEDRIQSILREDKQGTRSVATMRCRH